ncbi:unnamed protein product (macronuclear) [Paramecium tetraurelia]|uniref:AMP-dependent synthetase/ligase domain-containing protein n=1 Tax=Paramecium tetraurelia TaxID=5888 RepID=A0CMG2_PARTE|nr:uncharacterized protein GSPATT00008458001 [Paramecium tetraurelia]CAK71979.1 unnamed protein product [Paramecium tetraurelia]|eukprot:XP_001439376.1 hypothetical protein (macronuclear) [Paramecium tetraurelia strain d4-2]
MGCGVSNAHQFMRYSQEKVTENELGSLENNKGQTTVRRNVKYTNQLLMIPQQGITTLQEMLNNSVAKFGNQPCLGKYEGDNFQFLSYNQVNEEAIHLGSGISNLNLVKEVQEYQHYKLKLIGIFAKNRREWMILDWANIIYGYTMVPFYDTLGPESIPFILDQTNIETMLISADATKSLLQCKEKHKLKNLVLLDPLSEQQANDLKNKGYHLFKFEEVVENGKKSTVQHAQVQPSSVYTLCYTSGTTGNPKGAILSHGNFISAIGSTQATDANITSTDVHLSYLPLPHVMERLIVLTMLFTGSSIGFYRGDPNLLKEDIQKLRPTIFASVPRLYNKFYDGIKAKINEVTGVKKSFAERAVRVKLENLRSEAKYTSGLYDKAFQGVRDLFGGRCRLMITGSAPIQQEVIDFLKIAACCPILEGYGQTESTALSFSTGAWDPKSAHLGGPAANTEFKLVDVPDMNYTSLDVVNGVKTPRGEICLKGHGVFLGYYKDPEKTAEAIDEAGWLHTGDIGLITENGGVKIIDRKKNIFKLQQGEYIAPEKIEAIYNRVQGVSESFIYGDSLQSQIVAIIVPMKDFVEKYAAEKSIQGDFEQLCKNPEIISYYQKNINDYGRANKLNSLEIAKLVHLEPQPLQTFGCLTSTFKLQRHIAKQVFAKQIEQLYKSQA